MFHRHLEGKDLLGEDTVEEWKAELKPNLIHFDGSWTCADCGHNNSSFVNLCISCNFRKDGRIPNRQPPPAFNPGTMGGRGKSHSCPVCGERMGLMVGHQPDLESTNSKMTDQRHKRLHFYRNPLCPGCGDPKLLKVVEKLKDSKAKITMDDKILINGMREMTRRKMEDKTEKKKARDELHIAAAERQLVAIQLEEEEAAIDANNRRILGLTQHGEENAREGTLAIEEEGGSADPDGGGGFPFAKSDPGGAFPFAKSEPGGAFPFAKTDAGGAFPFAQSEPGGAIVMQPMEAGEQKLEMILEEKDREPTIEELLETRRQEVRDAFEGIDLWNIPDAPIDSEEGGSGSDEEGYDDVDEDEDDENVGGYQDVD